MASTIVIVVLSVLCACLLATTVTFGLAAAHADAEAAELRQWMAKRDEDLRFRSQAHEALATNANRLEVELAEARAELDRIYQRPGPSVPAGPSSLTTGG